MHSYIFLEMDSLSASWSTARDQQCNPGAGSRFPPSFQPSKHHHPWPIVRFDTLKTAKAQLTSEPNTGIALIWLTSNVQHRISHLLLGVAMAHTTLPKQSLTPSVLRLPLPRMSRQSHPHCHTIVSSRGPPWPARTVTRLARWSLASGWYCVVAHQKLPGLGVSPVRVPVDGGESDGVHSGQHPPSYEKTC